MIAALRAGFDGAGRAAVGEGGGGAVAILYTKGALVASIASQPGQAVVVGKTLNALTVNAGVEAPLAGVYGAVSAGFARGDAMSTTEIIVALSAR